MFESESEERWISTVNADPEFQLAGRWTDVGLDIRCGTQTVHYRIAEGRLDAQGPSGDDRVVVLEGSDSAWADFLAPVPLPKNHHVLAMDRHRADFTIASGRHWLIQNLRVIDLVLQLLRRPSTSRREES
tara:strand:- start:565 stop:954 length:390 start_codon:yes stop_codon:yes gene_type:complete